MKARAGKIANRISATACSAFLLTTSSAGLAKSTDAVSECLRVSSNSATTAASTGSAANAGAATTPTDVAPTTAPTTNATATPTAATTDEAAANSGTAATSHSAPTNSDNTGSTTNTPAATSTSNGTSGAPQLDQESKTNQPLPANSCAAKSPPNGKCLDPNKIFLHFIEAVTGKPATPDICDLMQNVVSLQRVGESIELTKNDSSKVVIGGDTHFGAIVLGDFSDAREKVAAKFGDEVGRLIDEFVGVTSRGQHLEVIRNGPEVEDIDLSERKTKKQLPLRRVRFSKISLDVDMENSHPVLKNITGIEAVPSTGFEIPIVLKEFSRSKNQDGDDVFTFGVKNPFPLIKSFKRLLGLKEIVPFTWTAKKQDNKEIGAKQSEPAQH